jgi:hypothetical protein
MILNKKAGITLTVCVSAFVLAACQFSLSLWVTPDSTADDLVFGFSESRNGEDKVRPSSIRVFPCDSIRRQPEGGHYPSEAYAVWSASVPYGTASQPTNRLAYGKDEYGLQTRQGPKPLAVPGCYVVIAYADDKRGNLRVATVGFNISDDGQAVEMSRSSYEKVFDK